MAYEIDEIRKVKLGGVNQKIHIRGEKKSNPVLLFLHGGPGVTNRHGVLARHSDLCDDFTIVCWDQRGTGGSYWGVKDESLNLNQLIEDAAEPIPEIRSTIYSLIEKEGWKFVARKELRTKRYFIKRTYYSLPKNIQKILKRVLK